MARFKMMDIERELKSIFLPRADFRKYVRVEQTAGPLDEYVVKVLRHGLEIGASVRTGVGNEAELAMEAYNNVIRVYKNYSLSAANQTRSSAISPFQQIPEELFIQVKKYFDPVKGLAVMEVIDNSMRVRKFCYRFEPTSGWRECQLTLAHQALMGIKVNKPKSINSKARKEKAIVNKIEYRYAPVGGNVINAPVFNNDLGLVLLPPYTNKRFHKVFTEILEYKENEVLKVRVHVYTKQAGAEATAQNSTYTFVLDKGRVTRKADIQRNTIEPTTDPLEYVRHPYNNHLNTNLPAPKYVSDNLWLTSDDQMFVNLGTHWIYLPPALLRFQDLIGVPKELTDEINMVRNLMGIIK